MGLRGWVIERGMRASAKNIPSASAALTYNDRGRVGKANVALYRNWAEHSPWVRAAINVRKSQISSADWDIVPFNTELPIDESLQSDLRELFDRPNGSRDSFRSFIEPIVEDILVLDAGVIEKERALGRQVIALWGVDGGKIRVNALWDGSNENEPRYYWYPDGMMRASFTNADMVYMMANPRTYSPIGLSPMETLKMTIDAELQSSDYNTRQVTSAAPDGILDLGEGARPEQVESFKSYWLAEIAGKGAMAFLGGSRNAKFIPFRPSNRDMQFTEWQNYLVRKIAAVFGLSPQDLGLTFDVNRSTSEVQQEQTEDRGLRPLLALIQEYLTREIVWDDVFGGKDANLAFRFTRLNLKETTSRASINKLALAGVPWKTINEARVEDGREPVGPEYDQLIAFTPQGPVALTDIPNAREWLDSRNPPSAPAGAGNPASATAGRSN